MKKLVYLSVLIIVVISGCERSSKSRSFADVQASPEFANISTNTSINVKNQVVDKKKIIKDGRIGIKTRNLETCKKLADTLLIRYSGYYEKENFNNSEYESWFDLKIRVPGENFEKFIDEVVSGDGEITYKEINARDVTEEFVDLEIRLNNKRNYLKRYNELLKQAKSVKDILEIEEKTRAIEEEIESAEGRLKYLSDQVAYSTLELRISRRSDFKFKPSERANFFEKLKQSLSRGWYGFIDFLLFMIKIWPLWLIVAIGCFIWKKYKSRLKKKSSN